MLKFEYHHLTNTLYTQKPGEPRRSITKTFTTNWGGAGFVLEPVNHWITFTIYPNKIRVFYKQVKLDEQTLAWPSELEWKDWKVSADTLAPVVSEITYYQKDLPKEEKIIFTFAPADQVEKVNGVWVKKHS